MRRDEVLILIVDDFHLARHQMHSTLSSLGYTNLIEANKVTDAMDILIRQEQDGKPVHLVTCDINMPALSGCDFLKAVRAHARFKKLPIVMVTVHSDKLAVQKVLDLGASVHISKPFSVATVEKTLEALLKI